MLLRRSIFIIVWAIACALVVPLLAAAEPQAKRVEVYRTAKNTGDRLARKEPLTFEPLPQPTEGFPTIMIDPSKTFQVIEGFGGALTDSAAETFALLPVERQRELLRAYFDSESGIGYTLCRTSIHSCDFSSESYTYVDAGDAALKSFSVAHDRRYRIPFIKAALAAAKNGIKIFASPWSPPAWMKTNDDMLHGGSLRPEYRDAWARYFVRFVEEYEKAGVPIWGLTVQNEPGSAQKWESCKFTAEEERDFVRDHLGPALEKAGLSRLRLIIWDHNRGLLYQRAQTVYEDPRAARYVWGAGFHWYVGDHFDNVRLLHDAFPDKQLVLTEACAYPVDWTRKGDWYFGEQYGVSLLHDLNNWAAGWVDWNVLLDERGGPNHVGNYAFAPVFADRQTGKLDYTSTYYYIGHVSRFVRPGAKRIACTSNKDDLLSTAFVNPDGRLAVVVMNRTEQDIEFQLWMSGRAVHTTSPAHSMTTLVY